jgi:uncharacterized protein YceK
MENIEYKALKKEMMTKTGADDKETLIFHAENYIKAGKGMKWCCVAMIIVGIPLSLVVIGMLMIPFAIAGALYAHFKICKHYKKFIEFVEVDPEFTKS